MNLSDHLARARRVSRIRELMGEVSKGEIVKLLKLALNKEDELDLRKFYRLLLKNRKEIPDLGEIGRNINDNKYKSFTDLLKGLEDGIKVRVKGLVDALEKGIINTRSFGAAISKEIRESTLMGALIGTATRGYVKGFRDSLNKSLASNLARFRRMMSRLSSEGIDAVRRSIRQLANNVRNMVYSSAVEVMRRTQEGAEETRDELRRLGELDAAEKMELQNADFNNLDELVKRYGHIRVERRISVQDKSTCEECDEYHKQGWALMGDLPDIGSDARCGKNCRCRFDSTKIENLNKAQQRKMIRLLGRRGRAGSR